MIIVIIILNRITLLVIRLEEDVYVNCTVMMCRLQSQLSRDKSVVVSKVQPELLRQVSVNKQLGANSLTLRNGGAAANGMQVIHVNAAVFALAIQQFI